MKTSLISNEASRAVSWSWYVLTTLTALPFLLSAGMKLAQNPAVAQTFHQAGLPLSTMVPIGIVELVCVVLYLVPRTALLGTFLLTGYIGGAIVTNLILHSDTLPVIALGLIAWAGAWLRIPQLRTLLPLRRSSAPVEVPVHVG